MKLKHLLMKTLFVAVGLCVGQSVWADATTAFSQDFTAVGESTDPTDYGFALTYGAGSSSELVNFTVSDGKLNCSMNINSSGARTGTATATFSSVGAGNEVTVSYVWAIGSATGNASGSYTKTRIGNASGNALELSFYGSESNGSLKLNGTTIKSGNTAIRNTTYTVNATLNMNTQKITALTLTCSNATYSYTASDPINFASAITSVDRFAFENSTRQNWVNTASVDNVSITYEEAKESVESFVVNYKYGETIIVSENIGTAGLYAGDSYTVPFRMYVSKDGALYKTTANGSNPYYGDAITLTKNTVVNKSLSAVDLNGGTLELLEDLDDTNGENADIRASYRSAYNNKSYTSAVTLSPGVYTFITRALNKGRGSSIAVGSTTVCDIDGIVAKNSWGDKTFTNVAIPVAGNVTLVKGGGNTIDCYDIIIAILHSVPVTITSAGWATFSSDHALDFSSVSSLEAYMITGHSGNVVTKTQVTGTVPAGTGLLLKGVAGNYNIPVAASSSTDVSANLMVAGTGASVSYEAGKTKYILGLNGADAEFQKLVDGGSSATVAKGKAYLQFNEVISARSLYFEDEVTGIANVEAAAKANAKEGKFIENGKLVIVKNGVKYNVAGAKLY